MTNNLSMSYLMIDCENPQRAQDFYAGLMGCEAISMFGCSAIKTDNGLNILFSKPEIPYAAPVWPEESNKQQKQMHLDFVVDDLTAMVKKSEKLGAVRAAAQYGGSTCVTMFDSEGHPFCLLQRQEKKSDFDLYYEKAGYGAIPDISINIDCTKFEMLRGFYARLTGWDQGFHPTALIPENRMVVHFMECDFDYCPPVWPERLDEQQKQMHIGFLVNDLRSAVDEALRIGAKKAASNCSGHIVTMLDPDGHPFCLCKG